MKNVICLLSILVFAQIAMGQDDGLISYYVRSFAHLVDVAYRSGQDYALEKYPDYVEYMTYEESASVAKELYNIKVIGVNTLKIIDKRCQRSDDQKASEEGFDRVYHKLESSFNELRHKVVHETDKERFNEAVRDAQRGLELIQDAKQKLVAKNLI